MYLLDNEERNTIKSCYTLISKLECDRNHEDDVRLVKTRLERSFPLEEIDLSISDTLDRLMQIRANSILMKLYEAGGDLKRGDIHTDEVKNFSVMSEVTSWMVDKGLIERYSRDRRIHYRLKKVCNVWHPVSDKPAEGCHVWVAYVSQLVGRIVDQGHYSKGVFYDMVGAEIHNVFRWSDFDKPAWPGYEE